MAQGLRVGSVTPRFVADLSLSPSSVAPNNISVETYNVPGLTLDMLPYCVQQVPDSATTRIISSRVSSASTLELTFYNWAGVTGSFAANQEFKLVCF